jgi:hypothetical protein
MLLTKMANRYTTPVTVEVATSTNFEYKVFSDMQMAYIWIKSRVDYYMLEHNCNLFPFQQACDDLDIAYMAAGLRGSTLVAETPVEVYRVYYGKLEL